MMILTKKGSNIPEGLSYAFREPIILTNIETIDVLSVIYWPNV